MSSNAGRLGVLETRGSNACGVGGCPGPVQRPTMVMVRFGGGCVGGCELWCPTRESQRYGAISCFKKAARQRYGAISRFAKILAYPTYAMVRLGGSKIQQLAFSTFWGMCTRKLYLDVDRISRAPRGFSTS